MHSPETLAHKLERQWQNADYREARLLQTNDTTWPIRLSIGKPTADQVTHRIETVRAHIKNWNTISIGTIEWSTANYRAISQPIEVPTVWTLNRPSEWIAACRSKTIEEEYKALMKLCAKTSSIDHTTWVRRRYLWQNKPLAEVIQAAALAERLSLGCAQGRPLRALSVAGIDSKFFERHRRLIIELLDTRYHGIVSEQGLESFLDAAHEHDHWLLLADLDGNLLPFKQQRIRSSELATVAPVPGSRLLIVENEQVLHLLPQMPDTLALLGAGNNLKWLRSKSLDGKSICYWGDLDTWGLRLLSKARALRPHLHPLLMDKKTFRRYAADKAVPETEPAQSPPSGLEPDEQNLFHYLRNLEKGRLEQEFIPEAAVHESLANWQDPH